MPSNPHFCFLCLTSYHGDPQEAPLPNFSGSHNFEIYPQEMCPRCYEVKERRFDEYMAKETRYRCEKKKRKMTSLGLAQIIKSSTTYFRDQQSRDFIEKNGGYGNIPPY